MIGMRGWMMARLSPAVRRHNAAVVTAHERLYPGVPANELTPEQDERVFLAAADILEAAGHPDQAEGIRSA